MIANMYVQGMYSPIQSMSTVLLTSQVLLLKWALFLYRPSAGQTLGNPVSGWVGADRGIPTVCDGTIWACIATSYHRGKATDRIFCKLMHVNKQNEPIFPYKTLNIMHVTDVCQSNEFTAIWQNFASI